MDSNEADPLISVDDPLACPTQECQDLLRMLAHTCCTVDLLLTSPRCLA